MKYLLTDNPDLNPIEQVFAKLKALPAQSHRADSRSTLADPGKLLDEVQAEECRNYFQNAGYASN